MYHVYRPCYSLIFLVLILTFLLSLNLVYECFEGPLTAAITFGASDLGQHF